MTTLTHPRFTLTAKVESILAAALAAGTLLVLLVWMMTGAAGAMSSATASPAPSAQTQSAPTPSGATASPTDSCGSGVLAPNPQPQVAPPRPDRQRAHTGRGLSYERRPG